MKLHVVTILTILSCCLGYPQSNTRSSGAESPDSDMYLEQETRVEREPNQQSFYPSFPAFQNPPLGHSRPFFFQQEAAYSQRPHSGYQQQHLGYDSPRYSGYKDAGYQRATNSETRGLLGSGNFGVIRGGTFYDKDAQSSNYDNDYGSYFRNGHGRPSSHHGGGVPNPKPYPHEQFENFRDFADINTPSAYSQFVVVYVNKNETKQIQEKEKKRPKNIIESLALLDSENSPEKKLSKSKAKLAKLLPEKKHKYKESSPKAQREFHEPLLALS